MTIKYKIIIKNNKKYKEYNTEILLNLIKTVQNLAGQLIFYSQLISKCQKWETAKLVLMNIRLFQSLVITHCRLGFWTVIKQMDKGQIKVG